MTQDYKILGFDKTDLRVGINAAAITIARTVASGVSWSTAMSHSARPTSSHMMKAQLWSNAARKVTMRWLSVMYAKSATSVEAAERATHKNGLQRFGYS